ncbi:hypothetical protein SAMN05428947_10270 [Mucilaginibacter sp. OK283]|jgi:hypothetical protein|nr:hypothetical protein SAMN05428947_10270 [Mucilaginibacter sp. OK283]
MNYLLLVERFSKTCHYASIIALLHVLWVTKILCRNYNTGPLMAAGGPISFCLGKRNQNRCHQKCFALGASALQNGQNLGWNYFAPRLLSQRACKNFLCPAAAPPRIVLPVFARSCSADTLGITRTFSNSKATFPNSLPWQGRDSNAGKGREGLMNYLLSGERFSKTCHYASIIALLHVLWITKLLCRSYNIGPLMAAGGLLQVT